MTSTLHRNTSLPDSHSRSHSHSPVMTQTQTQTDILIVGAGAVGAFYGSRLATVSNTRVSVICRSNYNTVAKDGFKITSPSFEPAAFIPHRVFASPAEAISANISWDYAVVSTKALPDISDDSEILNGLVKDGTAIVYVNLQTGNCFPCIVIGGCFNSTRYSRFPPTDVLTWAFQINSERRWHRGSIHETVPISNHSIRRHHSECGPNRTRNYKTQSLDEDKHWTISCRPWEGREGQDCNGANQALRSAVEPRWNQRCGNILSSWSSNDQVA
jgi:hypothetical protein